MVLLTLSALACACAGRTGITKTTTVPAAQRPVTLVAGREQLLENYNGLARNLQSLDATVDMKPSAGSAYSGVISEYHDVKAFILATRPYDIRLIGQVPIAGTTVFDMASDGHDFEVSIPPKNQFLIGPVSLNRTSTRPIENLRPQHLVDALLWPEVHKQEQTLFEEFDNETGRYYIITVLRGGYEPEILRKIWFDRTNLQFGRLQTYGPQGVLRSDVVYADWQPPDNPSTTLPGYPRTVHINRPRDEYRLDLTFSKVVVNQPIASDRFQLQPPQGVAVVRLTDGPDNKQP